MISTIAEGRKLEEKYRDHYLSGDYAGCRECHVEPDWLLVYEVMDKVLVLMIYRVGTHSELLKKTEESWSEYRKKHYTAGEIAENDLMVKLELSEK